MRCPTKDNDIIGTRVNPIYPGYSDTPTMVPIFSEKTDPTAARRAIIDKQPAGRLITLLDIAYGLVFLPQRRRVSL
jgi:NAD(P)-dependent dehydrogenase (short-subunit alcohol dehydrogenase family)